MRELGCLDFLWTDENRRGIPRDTYRSTREIGERKSILMARGKPWALGARGLTVRRWVAGSRGPGTLPANNGRRVTLIAIQQTKPTATSRTGQTRRTRYWSRPGGQDGYTKLQMACG